MQLFIPLFIYLYQTTWDHNKTTKNSQKTNTTTTNNYLLGPNVSPIIT